MCSVNWFLSFHIKEAAAASLFASGALLTTGVTVAEFKGSYISSVVTKIPDPTTQISNAFTTVKNKMPAIGPIQSRIKALPPTIMTGATKAFTTAKPFLTTAEAWNPVLKVTKPYAKQMQKNFITLYGLHKPISIFVQSSAVSTYKYVTTINYDQKILKTRDFLKTMSNTYLTASNVNTTLEKGVNKTKTALAYLKSAAYKVKFKGLKPAVNYMFNTMPRHALMAATWIKTNGLKTIVALGKSFVGLVTDPMGTITSIKEMLPLMKALWTKKADIYNVLKSMSFTQLKTLALFMFHNGSRFKSTMKDLEKKLGQSAPFSPAVKSELMKGVMKNPTKAFENLTTFQASKTKMEANPFYKDVKFTDDELKNLFKKLATGSDKDFASEKDKLFREKAVEAALNTTQKALGGILGLFGLGSTTPSSSS